MDRHPYAAEDREDMLCEPIDARIHAIKHDIRINRVSTTEAVLARLPIADEDLARDVLRRAVVGHSAAVGVAHAHAVELAIFQEAEVLAESDLADMEQRRRESLAEDRVERAAWALAMA
jgi:hypothetical protein